MLKNPHFVVSLSLNIVDLKRVLLLSTVDHLFEQKKNIKVFLNDLPSHLELFQLTIQSIKQRNKIKKINERNKKEKNQKKENFFSKPNQKFQKVFLANQKIRKKYSAFLLPLPLLHPKPSIQHQQSIVSGHQL